MTRLLNRALWLTALLMGLFLAAALWQGTRTLAELLQQNERLRVALANLSAEAEVATAQVVSQETIDGRLRTHLRFRPTSLAGDPGATVELQLQGRVGYFDSLIISFPPEQVADGEARALLLWQRAFDAATAPENGTPLETPGTWPGRYRELFRGLLPEEQGLLTSAFWDLAHDPEALERYGIRAAYGSAVSTELRPGYLYRFFLTAAGQLYVVPERLP